MSTIAVTAPRRVLADSVPRTLLSETALVVGAACAMGLLAQVTIHLSFSPVPITGQTFGVMLAGTALGWRRAGFAMALYVAAGCAGLPWFADHASGYPAATFGYLLGFVVAGPVLGWLAARGNDRTLTRAFASMAVGDLIVFAFGVTWLAFDLHVGAGTALALGFTPYLVGEVIKAALSGAVLPATWRLLDRSTRA